MHSRELHLVVIYTGFQKMAQSVLNALTLSNINRFLKFFLCQNQDKICIKINDLDLCLEVAQGHTNHCVVNSSKTT